MSEPMHPAARAALWVAGTAAEVVISAVAYVYIERWLGKRLDREERRRVANLPRVTPVVDLRPARGGQ